MTNGMMIPLTLALIVERPTAVDLNREKRALNGSLTSKIIEKS